MAVTGAGGFIGGHLVRSLCATGVVVHCLDGMPKLVRAMPELVETGRLRASSREQTLDDVLAACDSLVHLAFRPPEPAAAGRAYEPPSSAALTRQILDAAAAAGTAHICFASSTSVYEAGVGVGESAPTQSRTAYARLKLEEEAQIADWSVRTGRPAAILRLSTVYGPGESAHRAIPAFFRAALAGRPPMVSGQGRGPFDPVYVGDVVEAFWLALLTRADGVFNVGTGIARAPVDVARLVARLCGLGGGVAHDPHEEDRARPVCSVEKARRGLGFEARTTIEAGLALEAEWFRAAT